MITVTRLDELRQARAMLLRLLDDGKPLPPVEGVDELQRLFPPPAARCGLALASGVEISRSLGFI